ncbi:MAG: M16 family metallopeptidase [Acidobacteriota bacterium]
MNKLLKLEGTGTFLLLCAIGCMLLFQASGQDAEGRPEIVTISSPSPMVGISIMVKSGSIDDPAGHEGLAHLTAETLLEGSFGDPDNLTTKEELALITRPWGSGASPSARVAKEVTTFYMSVPEDVLDQYLNTVLQPLFTQPFFQAEELERLRNETLEEISALRYENIESLGLEAIDHYVFDGVSYAHLSEGSVQGLKQITRQDLLTFYAEHYRSDNLIIGLSKEDPKLRRKITSALADVGSSGADEIGNEQSRPRQEAAPPPEITGRHLVIVSVPNLESTGIHAAFPIPITRTDPDYWPLYIANVFLGTHRDSFGVLYQEIRHTRGYNYGNYSYIEHFAGRPFLLFPPFNTPRRYQYFSIWLRPVADQYTHHLIKALTYELENFIRTGMSAEQVVDAKNKAKVLYLNLAETVPRLLNARLDDAYYGMAGDGYLDRYLDKIDAVTSEQVNEALRKYLQVQDIKYLVVTSRGHAGRLAQEIAQGGLATGKTREEYRIQLEETEGGTIYRLSEDQLDMLLRDAVWSAYPLDIPEDNIRVAPVEQLFETGEFMASK